MKNKGLLIVVSGPSGVGKGTICEKLVGARDDISVSVSVTTRKPRVIDKEGVTYFFRSRSEFEEMIKANKFLEWAEYSGNYYGTPVELIDEKLERGEDVILEIEVQGALKVLGKRKDALSVFVAPPDEEALYARLRNRGTETEEQIEKRIKAAEEELKHKNKYDYIVVNDVLEDAVVEIERIIKNEKEKDAK